MLKIIDINKHYDNINVLNNINLTIETATSIALIGESGSGKTTLAKLIVGLERPDSGEIIFDDVMLPELIKRSFDMCTKIQYVFQDPYSALEDNLTIRQTLNETARICKRHKHNYMDAETALKYVDSQLLSYIDKKISILSGGQRQKVCIARAIMVNPSIIIIDEGTSMLDNDSGREIYKLLDKIKREKNVTIISILHQIDFENDTWDYVAVFHNGYMVEKREFKNFNKLCTHDYSKQLVAASQYLKSEEIINE